MNPERKGGKGGEGREGGGEGRREGREGGREGKGGGREEKRRKEPQRFQKRKNQQGKTTSEGNIFSEILSLFTH